MNTLPSELLLQIVRFLEDFQDKCQLSLTCRRFRNLLRAHPWCWSPLDFSAYGSRLTNGALLSILRNCSIPCVQPIDAPPVGCSTPNPATTKVVDSLDISGCCALTPEAIHLLACSLPHLRTLSLNMYSPSRATWPFEHREHLYHIQPSHNLSSLAMDLSKEPSLSLGLLETTLQQILARCPEIKNLSLQYQSLTLNGCKAILKLKWLTHLDVSSCSISQPSLQLLLRSTSPKLISLKLLNIDLTDLTLITIKLHAKNLICLHLSCVDSARLGSIAHVVGSLNRLQDFRLTRLRSGNVDTVVQRLNPATLKRLDISPKMDLHPQRNPRFFSRLMHKAYPAMKEPTNSGRVLRGPPGNDTILSNSTTTPPTVATVATVATPRDVVTTFTRTEHELHLTDESLIILARFHGLVELRLCYPKISDPSLMTALFDATPNLEILELRLEIQKTYSDFYRNSRSTKEGTLSQIDMLQGLQEKKDRLSRLTELAIYHTWLSPATARALGNPTKLRLLRSLTIYDCGKIADREPDIVRSWLESHSRLQVLRLGKIGQVRFELLSDLAVVAALLEEKGEPGMAVHQRHSTPGLVEDEAIFTRKFSASGERFTYCCCLKP
ncbi:hypothetical protein BX666DRAFT_1934762 [Dichotomocladium elegans]|nr:hypothetical protein BX666DRAFT_1934762 [Dichotomocladium elegans]